MIILRTSRYSEEKGSGWGKKLGAAALTVGTLYGAKKGLLGNNMSMMVNKGLMSAGKAVGSKSLYKSGATDYAKGYVNNISNSMKMTGAEGLSKMEKARGAATFRSNLMNNFNSTKPSTNTGLVLVNK